LKSPCPIVNVSAATTGFTQRPSSAECFLSHLPDSRVIIGSFDILVDIGVPAEKEVIQ